MNDPHGDHESPVENARVQFPRVDIEALTAHVEHLDVRRKYLMELNEWYDDKISEETRAAAEDNEALQRVKNKLRIMEHQLIKIDKGEVELDATEEALLQRLSSILDKRPKVEAALLQARDRAFLDESLQRMSQEVRTGLENVTASISSITESIVKKVGESQQARFERCFSEVLDVVANEHKMLKESRDALQLQCDGLENDLNQRDAELEETRSRLDEANKKADNVPEYEREIQELRQTNARLQMEKDDGLVVLAAVEARLEEEQEQ